ncbi:MAG: hypothetical protein Q9M91_06235, partial [Candidatus Dojkabacteria bacterium]|nr:hypothetical protein [Candidatus Dojkabacteria bacterium]
IPNANMATYAIASSERPAVEGLRGMLNRIVGSLKAKFNMDTKGREWDSAEIAANKGNLWAMICVGNEDLGIVEFLKRLFLIRNNTENIKGNRILII